MGCEPSLRKYYRVADPVNILGVVRQMADLSRNSMLS
jgi:hypothetical protein